MARVFCLLVALWVSVHGGCGNSNQDAVIAQYQRGEDAIAQGDGAGLLAVITPDCAEYLEQAVVLALRASEADTKALNPTLMRLVIALRNRVPLQQLRGMDPEHVLTWQMDQDLMIVDADYDIAPMQVVVRGNTAEMQMGMKVEARSRSRFGRRGLGLATGMISSGLGRTKLQKIDGLVYTFRRIGNTWYADFRADESMRDRQYSGFARDEGVTVEKLVLLEEEDTYGSLKPNIWWPPSE